MTMETFVYLGQKHISSSCSESAKWNTPCRRKAACVERAHLANPDPLSRIRQDRKCYIKTAERAVFRTPSRSLSALRLLTLQQKAGRGVGAAAGGGGRGRTESHPVVASTPAQGPAPPLRLPNLLKMQPEVCCNLWAKA